MMDGNEAKRRRKEAIKEWKKIERSSGTETRRGRKRKLQKKI